MAKRPKPPKLTVHCNEHWFERPPATNPLLSQQEIKRLLDEMSAAIAERNAMAFKLSNGLNDDVVKLWSDPMDLSIEEARPIIAWTMYRLLSLRIHKPARLLYPSLSFPIDPMPQPDPGWDIEPA